MQEPAITSELIEAHGLKPDEYDLILQIIGREPSFNGARHLLGHVERTLFLQILQEMAAHFAHRRPSSDLWTG